MNILKTLSILLLFIACNESTPKVVATEKLSKSSSFFDFDEAVHFRIDKITETLADSMFVSEDNHDEGKKKFRILYGYKNYPHRLNDSTFLNELSALYKFQQKISADKLAEMSSIFSEHKINKSMTSTSCDPRYRDVFIFKKDGVISGIAKICFDCGQSYIIGSKRNTELFGENGEFDKLEKLLKK